MVRLIQKHTVVYGKTITIHNVNDKTNSETHCSVWYH